MLEVKLVPKLNNYMFIDKESGLILNLLHNKGVVESATPSIIRGVESGKLEVIDLPKIKIEEDIKATEVIESVEPITEPIVKEVEVVEEPKKPAKKNTRAKKTAK